MGPLRLANTESLRIVIAQRRAQRVAVPPLLTLPAWKAKPILGRGIASNRSGGHRMTARPATQGWPPTAAAGSADWPAGRGGETRGGVGRVGRGGVHRAREAT